MKVKNLMALLSKEDPEAKVKVLIESSDYSNHEIRAEIGGLTVDEDDDNVYVRVEEYREYLF